MVYKASSFDQDLEFWNILRVTSVTDFLRNRKITRSNFDNTLLGWSRRDTGETNIPSNLNVHFGSSNYSNDATVLTARNTKLINTYGWTITDGGMVSVLTKNAEILPV